MTSEFIDKINEIGAYKWGKNIFICPCKTIDNLGEENEQTLVVLTNDLRRITFDIPIEKILTIDKIRTLENSRFALDKCDVLRAFNAFEFKLGDYGRVQVKNPLTNSMIYINPRNIKEYFFYNTRPEKIRLVFSKLDDKIITK